MNAHSLNGQIRLTLASLLAIVCISQFSTQAGEQPRTLQTFGVQVKHGQPVYPMPNNVALGLFNPDPLLDLAYYAEGKIQVWQNLGNGTFGSEPVWERGSNGVVEKMEFKKTRMLTETIFDKDSWGDLVITYAGGREEKVSHEWMNRASKSFASLPQMTSSFPPLNFREVWRSPPNGQPVMQVAVGDIDNDGRVEVGYCFYPRTGSSDSLNRFVVYENQGHGLYAVEWDTLIRIGGGPYGITDIDNDGHKEWVMIAPPGMWFWECYGPRSYRPYSTNIVPSSGYGTFRAQQADIDHDGISELVVLTANPRAIWDATLIYVAEFVSKGPRGGGGWLMAFNQELARYQHYTFDMTIGQVDGVGTDEIIPAGGSLGYYEPVPVQYLWRAGLPAPNEWLTRNIHTGLESGTGAVMFVNLDADTAKEFVSGAPGPLGHGSMFALDYVSDTTWRVVWADSSLRNAPLWLNSGILSGQFVVAGANTWGRVDTLYSELHCYSPAGSQVGFWRRDSSSIQQFHFLDIDRNGRTNLVFAHLSEFMPDHYATDFEIDSTTGIKENQDVPRGFELEQNFPNPFNPVTSIRIAVPHHARVALRIYNMLGQLVATLFNEEKEIGEHSVLWDGSNFPSGVYFYRLESAKATVTKKMLLLR